MRCWFEPLILRLSYALAEDAARFCELVGATPDKRYGDCASMAFFNYDAGLYNELLGIHNKRLGEIKAAHARGEFVEHVVGMGTSDDAGRVNDNRSRLSWLTMNSAKTSLLPSWRNFVWGSAPKDD